MTFPTCSQTYILEVSMDEILKLILTKIVSTAGWTKVKVLIIKTVLCISSFLIKIRAMEPLTELLFVLCLLRSTLLCLQILQNDIQAHQASVDSVVDAGRALIADAPESDEGRDMHEQLRELSERWETLQAGAAAREKLLQDSLKEAQGFSGELQDMLLWLSEIDGQLISSKPVGGLPETAKEQLLKFMVGSSFVSSVH